MQVLNRLGERTALAGTDAAVVNELIDHINALSSKVLNDDDADDFSERKTAAMQARLSPVVETEALAPTAVPTLEDVERMMDDKFGNLLRQLGEMQRDSVYTYRDQPPSENAPVDKIAPASTLGGATTGVPATSLTGPAPKPPVKPVPDANPPPQPRNPKPIPPTPNPVPDPFPPAVTPTPSPVENGDPDADPES